MIRFPEVWEIGPPKVELAVSETYMVPTVKVLAMVEDALTIIPTVVVGEMALELTNLQLLGVIPEVCCQVA